MDLQIDKVLSELKQSQVLDSKRLNDNINLCFDKCGDLQTSLDDRFSRLFKYSTDLDAEIKTVCCSLLKNV